MGLTEQKAAPPTTQVPATPAASQPRDPEPTKPAKPKPAPDPEPELAVAQLQRTTHKVGSHEIEMVFVPPGSFELGGRDRKGNTDKCFPAEHTYGYWFGTRLVTIGLYREVMGALPKFKETVAANKGNAEDEALQCVKFYDALEFCDKLSGLLGFELAFRGKRGWKPRRDWPIKSPDGFRLPLGAEWERAARAGRIGKSVKATRKPNAWGIHELVSAGVTKDMEGGHPLDLPGRQLTLDDSGDYHGLYFVPKSFKGKDYLSKLSARERRDLVLTNPISVAPGPAMRGFHGRAWVACSNGYSNAYGCIRLVRRALP